MNKFLASLPSTNFRIFITMLLTTLTATRYLASGIGWSERLHVDSWEPSWEWLTFLAMMAGIDLAQFYAKRKTMTESPPAGPDIEDAKAGTIVPNKPTTIRGRE